MTRSISLNQLGDEDIDFIRAEVDKRLGEAKKGNQIIRDTIFYILELNARVLYYPVEDEDICGFSVQYKEKKFVFINTFIPLEKQIFAAAHELFHIWYSDIAKGWLLKSVILDNQDISDPEIQKEDIKANRFAAEFLMTKTVLINEMDIRSIKKDNLNLQHLVELMDIFMVPYKTIVLRLYEIGYLDEKSCKEFLNTPDRDDNTGVLYNQKKLSLCKRNNERDKRIKLDKCTFYSIEAYEKGSINLQKLKYFLSLEDKTLREFGYEEPSDFKPCSEEYILNALNETDE